MERSYHGASPLIHIIFFTVNVFPIRHEKQVSASISEAATSRLGLRQNFERLGLVSEGLVHIPDI